MHVYTISGRRSLKTKCTRMPIPRNSYPINVCRGGNDKTKEN